MYHLQFNPADKMPKFSQIVQSIAADIARGVLKNGEQLPSLSELSTEYEVSRVTVVRAYQELIAQGSCVAAHGRGYFVRAAPVTKLRVMLIINRLSSCKRQVYYALLAALGEQAQVELFVHHYSARKLQEILSENLGKYNYYVVMPHFLPDASQPDYRAVLATVPADQLVLLDKDVKELRSPCLRVCQDFSRDIFAALEGLRDRLAHYQRLVLVTPETRSEHLAEISWGFRTFCLMHNVPFGIQPQVRAEVVQPGTAYIVMDSSDLSELLKKARQNQYLLGKDIGVISFNDTPLKELLDITVISTDFEQMGRTTAQLLLAKQRVTVQNRFYTIRRGSL